MKQRILRKINNIIARTKWYNENYWRGVTKFWNQIPFNIDVVNLGSWPAVYGFNYENCNLIARNFALGPQSIAHDFSILKNYYSYLKEGATVIITIVPFSCLINNYNREHNFRYYTILHPATIQNFDESERIKALQIKQNPIKHITKVCIVNTIREYLSRWSRHKNVTKVDFQSSAAIFIRDWKMQFGIKNLEQPLSIKHLEEQKSRKETLQQMVEFCKERNLKAVLVIPPMHKELSKLLSDTFYSNYVENFIDGIDAPVYNYMREMKFQSDNYYRNALFLNDEGAKLFTSDLLAKLCL